VASRLINHTEVDRTVLYLYQNVTPARLRYLYYLIRH